MPTDQARIELEHAGREISPVNLLAGVGVAGLLVTGCVAIIERVVETGQVEIPPNQYTRWCGYVSSSCYGKIVTE